MQAKHSYIKVFLKDFFLTVCMCVSLCVQVSAGAHRDQKHWIPLELELHTGGWELSDMGAGNRTLVLCKNNA